MTTWLSFIHTTTPIQHGRQAWPCCKLFENFVSQFISKSYFLLMIILYCHNIKYVLPYYINLYKDANDLSKFNSILLTWCVFMITCIKIWPICSINLWKNFIMIDTLLHSRCMFISTFILLAFDVLHYTILMYLCQTKHKYHWGFIDHWWKMT